MGWFSKTDPGFFLATIVPDADGARVAQYLGVVNGEAIIGANIFRDLFSSVRDVVGGRAGGYEQDVIGFKSEHDAPTVGVHYGARIRMMALRALDFGVLAAIARRVLGVDGRDSRS